MCIRDRDRSGTSSGISVGGDDKTVSSGGGRDDDGDDDFDDNDDNHDMIIRFKLNCLKTFITKIIVLKHLTDSEMRKLTFAKVGKQNVSDKI